MLPLIIFMVLASTTAQKSPYYPNRSYPGLLPRFRPQEQDTGLDNRGGVDNSAEPTTTISSDLQGTLNEDRVVQRVADWPEDRQPFWFKNRHVVKDQRHHFVDGQAGSNQDWRNQRPVNWGNQNNNQRPGNWNQNENQRPGNWESQNGGRRRPTQQGVINSGQRSGAMQTNQNENY